MIEKQEIIQDLIRIKQELNKIPTTTDYEKTGKYCSKTVKTRFGSWSNAILATFNVNTKRRFRKENPCLNCNKITKNPKFCSQSCAATFNNLNPSKKRTKKSPQKCLCCKNDCFPQRKFCPKCQEAGTILTHQNKLIPINKATKKDALVNDTQQYRKIRTHARRLAKKIGKLDSCLVCQYSLHVECAHIKSIESFSDDTPLLEINNSQNLVGLCRNHHWEFNNGVLEIDEFYRK